LGVEFAGVALFGVLAVLGIAVSPWYLVGAWALHAAWDVAIPMSIDTAYMPFWYEAVCVGFDLVVTIYLAGVIRGWIPATGFRPSSAKATS
jgi:hypothetical protein